MCKNSNSILNQFEYIWANSRYLTEHECRTGRLHPVSSIGDTTLHQILQRGLITHFKERTGTFFHTNSVESTIVTVKSHKIANKRQMTIIYSNAIDFKNSSNFFNNIRSACFNTVSLDQSIRMVSRDSFQVEFFGITLKSLKRYTFNEQVVFLTRFLWRYKLTTFNTRHRSDQNTFKHAFSQIQHE